MPSARPAQFISLLLIATLVAACNGTPLVPTATVLPDETVAPVTAAMATPTPRPSSTPPAAATRTPSRTPTPHLSSTATPSITGTSSPQPLLKAPIAAFFDVDFSKVYLIDVNNGVVKTIDLSSLHAHAVRGWSESGCILYVSAPGYVYGLDWAHGQSSQLAALTSSDGYVIYDQVSPDGQWVSYIVGSGQEYYDGYEVQNIDVMGISEPFGPKRLTLGGGAGLPVWSNNSQWLAYRDLDSNGIAQLYVSSPDGSDIRQLTSLLSPEFTIGGIAWSPSSEYLALILDNSSDTAVQIGIVPLADPANIAYIEQSGRAGSLWWQTDSLLAVSGAQGPLGGSAAETLQTLTWYERNTLRLVAEFTDQKLSDGYFTQVERLSPDSVGFFSGFQFYSYAPLTDQLVSRFDQFADVRYWFAAPDNLPGELACQ